MHPGNVPGWWSVILTMLYLLDYGENSFFRYVKDRLCYLTAFNIENAVNCIYNIHYTYSTGSRNKLSISKMTCLS